ncbi:2-oxo-4-hydroxy-4-carboxy-5-ureidoimidazoline decarboxylase [Leeia sp.]|uniref:2-oxo-4-hydroxy-4-carboxy-5-ureidoimidazoline decarboxylase n=1 Tax=Leeia sp. TaxID=2884678 RepID=UPI0035B0AB16
MNPPYSLTALNHADLGAFVSLLGGVFEHSPWVAEGAWHRRPFVSVDDLHQKMCEVMWSADPARQRALICAHPELAGKAAIRGELTADSTKEQSGAGLTQCSPEEYARLQDLNQAYRDKFGFPFILAVKGWQRAEIIEQFAARLAQDEEQEFAECLRQIARIAQFRLSDLVKE